MLLLLLLLMMMTFGRYVCDTIEFDSSRPLECRGRTLLLNADCERGDLKREPQQLLLERINRLESRTDSGVDPVHKMVALSSLLWFGLARMDVGWWYWW